MKKALAVAIGTLAGLWGLWLLAANALLNLPATQDWLNGLAPERFAARWERGLSWYPLKVGLKGLQADGQTYTRQWQLDAEWVSAGLSLPALLQGRLVVKDLGVWDPELRLRPRPAPHPEPDAPHPELAAYYPEIRNRDPDSLAEPVPDPPPPPLKLTLDNARVAGTLALWVDHARATLAGTARTNLRLGDTGAAFGPASVDADLELLELRIADAPGIAENAFLKGHAELRPVPAEQAGLASLLRALDLTADLDLPVHSLRFLRFYAPAVERLGLTGSGRLRGRLAWARGRLAGDSDLVVAAERLALAVGRYAFRGHGRVELQENPDRDGTLRVGFDAVEVFLLGDPESERTPLYRGQGLSFDFGLPPESELRQGAAEGLRVHLDLGTLQAPDLLTYRRLLPAKWGVEILGGQGTLTGRAALTPEAFSLDLALRSDDPDLRYKGHRFTADLAMSLRARAEAGRAARLDLAGSAVRLDNVRLEVAEGTPPGLPADGAAPAEARTAAGTAGPHAAATGAPVSDPTQPHPAQPSPRGPGPAPAWQAGLAVTDGHLSVPLPKAQAGHGAAALHALADTLAHEGLGTVLDRGEGRLAAVLTVSRLDWIGRLLGNPFDLALEGAGELDLDVRLARGWLAEGSLLVLKPRALKLGILDHVSDGEGGLILKVTRGGERPDLHLDATLEAGRLRRRGAARSAVERVRLELTADVKALGPEGGKARVGLRIPEARVADMTVYNAYLPADARLRLAAGAADLVGELTLEPERAEGFFRLAGEGLTADLDTLTASADLRLEVLIRGGNPTERRFDIAGTSLVLDRVRIAGPAQTWSPADWRARLQAEKATVVWAQPMALDLTGEVLVRDTRPFVALLDNLRGEHGWIDRLLTLEDLAGRVELKLDGRRALIPYAMLGDKTASVGLKARAEGPHRAGVLYARWHDLTGLLRFDGERRGFELVDARAKFDAYAAGSSPVATVKTEASEPAKRSGPAAPSDDSAGPPKGTDAARRPHAHPAAHAGGPPTPIPAVAHPEHAAPATHGTTPAQRMGPEPSSMGADTLLWGE